MVGPLSEYKISGSGFFIGGKEDEFREVQDWKDGKKLVERVDRRIYRGTAEMFAVK
jgi:hypothetical protein